MRRVRPSSRLAAVALAAGLTLSACAGSQTAAPEEVQTPSEDVDAPALLAASIDQAEGEEVSLRTRTTSTTSTPQGDLVVTAEGVNVGSDAQLDMTLTGDAAAMLSGEEGDGVEIGVVLLDGTMYMRFPQLTEEIGADAEWISFDLGDLATGFESILQAAETADPASAMAALRDAGDVEIVGFEEIAGVPTTHLLVEVRLTDALDASGLGADDAAAAGLDADQVVTYDVWVDAEQRLRRLESSLEIEGISTDSVVEVLEYDVDETIEAPPADATVAFAELMAGAGPG